MSDFIFPFKWRRLPRAVEWLNARDDVLHKVTVDDVLILWSQGEIELCYCWYKNELIVPLIREFYRFDKGLGFPRLTRGGTPMFSVKPYGTTQDYSLTEAPPGSRVDPKRSLYDFSRNGLLVTRAEMLKIYHLVTTGRPLPHNTTINAYTAVTNTVHGNIERNAQWRERILLAAGYVKFKFPKECKNKYGKESAVAWAGALLNHWHLFGAENEAPSARTAADIIRDIFKLPSKRTVAGKNTE